MEVALRRRLEGVARISISQQRQTAEVSFAPGSHVFSPEQFRAAVKEADVDVISFEIDVCGRVEPHDGTLWLLAGPNRFALIDRRIDPAARTTCVTASLDDREKPQRLDDVRSLAS